MRYRNVRVGTVAMAVGGVLAAYAGSAVAEPGPTPSTYKQVTFKPQDTDVDNLIAAANMTKDQEGPARAFTGPTDMAVNPEDPRIVVAATADLRSKTCFLTVSKDAGRTWHFSEEPPGDPAYPYCTNTTAGVPEAAVAWGRDGTLYYARMAYGDGEGPREQKSSALLARTTNLGKSWTTTMVDNNRGKSGPTDPTVTSVPSMAVDTSGDKDIVYVGFSRSYPNSPTGDPLRNPNVMVATSIDGGATFGEPVNLNSFDRPSVQAGGKSYKLFMRTGFGAPTGMIAHDGVLLAVAGPDFPNNDQPAPPPEAGANLNPGSWYAYPMPQLIGRSTDQGKTWTISALGDPILAGTGSMTGMGWTQKGGENGTFVAVYAATPATSPTIALADIVMQRSTDNGVTWSSPQAIDDDPPEMHATGFYPQLNVAPNGRIDVAWQDDRELSDFNFNVRYTYSTDGGVTWAPNIRVNDKPVNFNYGVSFNSDLRQPNGVASTNSYAIIGWADTRNANELTQAQDNYASAIQFSPLPTTKNTTAPVIAAIFGGLVVAGLVMLVVLQMRKRDQGPAASAAGSRVAART
jgi:hypothetical protein